MVITNSILLVVQSVPPPVPPPPPPGLAIDKGVDVLFVIAVLYGGYFVWRKKNLESRRPRFKEKITLKKKKIHCPKCTSKKMLINADFNCIDCGYNYILHEKY
jgi:hypothetical protein